MDFLESTIEDFITAYGNSEEKEVYELYQGDFEETFGGKEGDLQEASGFAGGGTVIFSVLTFVLQCVGTTILEDTVTQGKKIILERLRKNKTGIVQKAADESTELTRETVEKLIVLLQKQLENLPSND